MEVEPEVITSPEKERLREVAGPVIYTGRTGREDSRLYVMRPIHYAAENKHDNTAAVEYLLCAGEPTNVKNEEGLTPLHFAVRADNRKIVDLLLNRYANLWACGSSGDIPLYFAFEDGRKDVDHNCPLYNTRLSIVKSLLQRGSPIEYLNSDFDTAILKAVKFRHLDIIKELLLRRPNLNAMNKKFQTCLHVLFQKPGKIDMMIELVKAGAPVHFYDKRIKPILEVIFDRHDVEINENVEEAKAFVKIAILVYYNERINFGMFQRDIRNFEMKCYKEVDRMKSISCSRKNQFVEFVLRGQDNLRLLDSVFNIMMRETFTVYDDYIMSHFSKIYLYDKLREKVIYTKSDPFDTVFPYELMRELSEVLSKKDLLNLLRVLINIQLQD